MRIESRHGRPELWVIVIATVVSVGIGAAVASTSALVPITALCAVLLGTAIVHRRYRLWELSPVAVLLFSYIAVALIGPLLSAAAGEALGAGARITLSAQESLGTYMIFMVAAGGTIVGAVIASAAAGPPPVLSNRDRVASQRPNRKVIVFAMAPAVLTIVVYGTALLDRPVYLIGQIGSPLVIAAQVLCIPAIVTLGWLAKSRRTTRGKLLSCAAILLYVILLFSLATRALSLVPVLVAIGVLAADPSSKRARIGLLAAAVASIFLLQTPITLRGSSEHGLFPYLAVLFDQQASGSGLTGAVSNILFSYALTGAVAFHAQPIDWSWALVSLDPRPGQLTDWYSIQPLLRVNVATPDNALGEIANHGLWPVFVSFLLIGAFFGYLDRRIRHLLFEGNALAALLLFAMSAFFVLESLQYNLRSASRIIYYLIAADLAIRVASRVWEHNQRSRAVVERLSLWPASTRRPPVAGTSGFTQLTARKGPSYDELNY